jgi:hypothetical protein
MSTEDVKLLIDKLDGLAGRVGSLEESVILLMGKSVKYERTIRWLRNAGLLLLGAALGSGVIHIEDLLALM